ncbi:MAG: hypothetical protein GEU78_10380 [Actinobacteria bacterium]|nr:hypothetical protein [Actinomycetota bacterium]
MFQTSVDKILSDFSKTVEQLEAHTLRLAGEIATLEDKHAAALKEAKRSDSVAVKLRELLDIS